MSREEADAQRRLLIHCAQTGGPVRSGIAGADVGGTDGGGTTPLPTIPYWLAALRWPAWLGPTLCLAAAGLGLASDAIGPSGRINLLAAPLLGVLAWNLLVVLVLALAAVRRALAPRDQAPHEGRGRSLASLALALARLRARWLPDTPPRAGQTASSQPGREAPDRDEPAMDARATAAWRARVSAEWLHESASLNRARASAWLHAAAASLATGLLAGLYWRGLAWEYRAGWDSTFLDAHAVRTLLGLLYGAASGLTGIALPDTATLDTLRLSSGNGANAAPWIHLIAVTVLLAAIAPRLALAAWDAARLPRLRRALARCWPLAPGGVRQVHLLACGWAMPAAHAEAIASDLRQRWGAISLHPHDSLSPESVDEPSTLPGLSQATDLVVVLNLGATPEPETHGAFLSAMRARLPGGGRLHVWLDETMFRQRFADTPRRLEERQSAWRDMLRPLALSPVFWRQTDPR